MKGSFLSKNSALLGLIEQNMGNIVLEKSYTKCVGETIPRPFLKDQNWACLQKNDLKFYKVCFYCMTNWGLSN